MHTQSISITVSPSIGSVSAECIIPENSTCLMSLAHGAGAGMNHPFIATLAQLLGELGIATLRFNFPFTEHKKARPDVPAVAHKTIEAVINKAQELFPSLPLFVSGKSFGGRMSSQYLALHPEVKVKGIVFFGFPLHAIGKPSVDRADHLKEIKMPMLFLQGTRDELATWALIESVCASLPLATLVKLEGANHAFKAKKEDNLLVLARATQAWLERIINT
ncbi:alpha/beta hydrolase family protein [Solitalea koreensis]|nr:alpha/beta family hydrolase [Solitalea koreensis]